MRTRYASLLAAGLLAGSVAALIGQERPVFRSGVDLVQIDVSVLDGKRQPVTGLTAADFTVLEDGQPRPVRAFAAVTLPAPTAPAGTTAVWDASVPSDVVTNEVGEQDGRLVIIMMDRTIPPGQPTVAARKIAETTIAALGPHDLAAVVSTSGGVPQGFTADHAKLLKAVSQRDFSTDVTDEAKAILGGLDAGLAPDRLSDGRCLCGLCVLESVTRLAEAVRDATGRRKVMFFIGSSLIVQAPMRAPSADVGCDRLLKDARNTMLDALDRSSLTIHTLDPQGLFSVGPQTRASTPNNGVGPGAPAARRAQMEVETNETLRNQEELGILPQRTGGRRIVNTNAPEEKVPEIFRESDSYYVLAYEPGSASRSGDHKIEVKVTRKGVQVFTNRRTAGAPAAGNKGTSAVAANAPRPATLGEALAGLLPTATRSLTVQMAAVAGIDDQRPTVNIHLDAQSFLEGRTASAPLEVGVVALDAFGHQVAAAKQTSTVSLVGGAVPGRLAEAPIETRLDLAPGDYDIRVAVRDPESGVVASVFAPFSVPSFATLPLSLSGVTLETTRTTIRRSFAASETVTAIGRLYESFDRDTIVPVSLQAQVLDATGRVVSGQTVRVTDREFVRHRTDYRLPILLAPLTPGAYLFRLEATAGAATVVKSVRFVVVP